MLRVDQVFASRVRACVRSRCTHGFGGGMEVLVGDLILLYSFIA